MRSPEEEIVELRRLIQRAYNMAMTQMDLPTAQVLRGCFEPTNVVDNLRAHIRKLEGAAAELLVAMDEMSPAERALPVRIIKPRVTAARQRLEDLIPGLPIEPRRR